MIKFKRTCMKMTLYLDYNATTPLAPEVLESIMTALKDSWGNPNSSHEAGQRALECITEARRSVAQMIGSSPEDIVFTSGGTESNNMVFHSVTQHWTALCKEGGVAGGVARPHIITSNLEHDSVQLCVRRMEAEGQIDLTELAADPSTGAVGVQDVLDALRPSSVLVSIMLAQNETGVLQPVREVVKAVRRFEKDTHRNQRVLVHTDAAQALGKVCVDAEELGVDYLTVVGHKYYGPRVGALFVRGLGRGGAPLYPMLYGGGQERGYRPGTQNTGMIAGLGMASKLVVDNVEHYHAHMKSVRDYLEKQLQDTFGERVCFNCCYPAGNRLPNTCNFSLLGDNLSGSKVLGALEHSQASVGAACHAHLETRPSPILLACGVPDDVARNAIRLSVGRDTSRGDIDLFMADLRNAFHKLTGESLGTA